MDAFKEIILDPEEDGYTLEAPLTLLYEFVAQQNEFSDFWKTEAFSLIKKAFKRAKNDLKILNCHHLVKTYFRLSQIHND